MQVLIEHYNLTTIFEIDSSTDIPCLDDNRINNLKLFLLTESNESIMLPNCSSAVAKKSQNKVTFSSDSSRTSPQKTDNVSSLEIISDKIDLPPQVKYHTTQKSVDFVENVGNDVILPSILKKSEKLDQIIENDHQISISSPPRPPKRTSQVIRHSSNKSISYLFPLGSINESLNANDQSCAPLSPNISDSIGSAPILKLDISDESYTPIINLSAENTSLTSPNILQSRLSIEDIKRHARTASELPPPLPPRVKNVSHSRNRSMYSSPSIQQQSPAFSTFLESNLGDSHNTYGSINSVQEKVLTTIATENRILRNEPLAFVLPQLPSNFEKIE